MTKLIKDGREFQDALKADEGILVLFYADWCPFSRSFLPVYEKLAGTGGLTCARIELDGNGELFDEYSVDVFPTVLYFKSGKVSKRLNGTPFLGLREKQLDALMRSCASD